MQPVQDRLIFHFTDHANLTAIVADGGLHCDSHMTQESRPFRECADDGIKGARRAKRVPCPPGGAVADYVPFYYATRSPMMSSISHGNVTGYTSNEDLIYLASSLNAVQSAGLPWVCTDGNARTAITGFFNQWVDLESNIDWEVMGARMWANTEQDGSRKHRRMAEFLVHGFFPFGLVVGIIAKSERVAEIVRGQLPGSPEVKVMAEHYI